MAALGGRLYAMGGYDGQSNLNTLERYYPEEDRWVLKDIFTYLFLWDLRHCMDGRNMSILNE